jgi:hypothetical protein
MEDQINRDMAVFHQVCEVNELDPKKIEAEAHKRFPGEERAERLIWTALDHRARSLIGSVVQQAGTDNSRQQGKSAYTIDGDPGAPSFVINEAAIRSQYDDDKATRIIEALGQVQLPVTG